jgi:hypothetical protein
VVMTSSNSTTTNDRSSRGWRRMRELRAEAEAERDALAAELLVGLGRPVTAVDRIAAETLAAAHVKAERLEASGRDATEERRLVAQLMRTSGFRPAKASEHKPDPTAALREHITRRYPQPPSRPTVADAPDAPANSTRTSDAAGGHSEAAR